MGRNDLVLGRDEVLNPCSHNSENLITRTKTIIAILAISTEGPSETSNILRSTRSTECLVEVKKHSRTGSSAVK